MAKRTFTGKRGERGGSKGAHHHMHDEDADYDPLLTGELSRCNSYDFDMADASGGVSAMGMAAAGGKDSASLCFQERLLVQADSVRVGMGRFSFLLETCAPGSVPDPLLISALLDLPRAPVIARACYLIECANFVHQCNRGHWPSWLKMNLPAYRPSKGQVLSTQPVQRRLQILQLQASKMFYQWAEVNT